MYRVMIVDDEPLILAGIASLLDWKEYGCEISGKAANGQQALKLMEEQKPDIVITDIKMPGMDGIGFMKAVKERGWDDVIFILLTNLEEFSLARQALSLGAVEYLVKMELTEEKLADSLRLAMERQELKRKADAAEAEDLPAMDGGRQNDRGRHPHGIRELARPHAAGQQLPGAAADGQVLQTTDGKRSVKACTRSERTAA